MYITNSEMLDDEYREIISSGECVLVSGQPLACWSDNKDSFFDDCSEVIMMPFIVHSVTIDQINPGLNKHLDMRYTGNFVGIVGFNPETNEEFRFAIRDELNFCLQGINNFIE
jgi:hypothetical protein